MSCFGSSQRLMITLKLIAWISHDLNYQRGKLTSNPHLHKALPYLRSTTSQVWLKTWGNSQYKICSHLILI
jgi:hypothetical protein